MFFGSILIAVGVIAILVNTDVLSGSIWDYFWPTSLVIIGLSFILGRFRRQPRHWWWGAPWDRWDDRNRPDKD